MRGSERGPVSEREKGREKRRVILPDKQRRRRDVCGAEEMLRKKGEAVPVSCIIYCMLLHLCEGPAGRSATVNRERGMMREREWRPELFSPGQEAGSEYLINSHQDSGGFTVLCCRTQTPQGKPSAQTRAMEHEHCGTERGCDTNREEVHRGRIGQSTLFFSPS